MNRWKEIDINITQNVLNNIIDYFGVNGHVLNLYYNTINGEYGILNFINNLTFNFNSERKTTNIYFENARLNRPVRYQGTDEYKLMPSEARRSYIPYFGNLYAEVVIVTDHYDINDNIIHREEDRKTVPFGSIPIMVKSYYCNLYDVDQKDYSLLSEKNTEIGGDYIAGKGRKVIEMRDSLRTEFINIIDTKKKVGIVCRMYIPTIQDTKLVQLCRGKMNNIKLYIKSSGNKNKQKNKETNKFNKNTAGKGNIDVIHIFLLLGFTIDDAISNIKYFLGNDKQKIKKCMQYFIGTETASKTNEYNRYLAACKFAVKSMLKLSFINIDSSTKVSDLVKTIGNNEYYKNELDTKVMNILDEELFPNINQMFANYTDIDKDFINSRKFLLICYMIKEYLEYFAKYRELTNKNDWNCKKLQISCDFIKQLYRIVIVRNFFNDNTKGNTISIETKNVTKLFNTASYYNKFFVLFNANKLTVDNVYKNMYELDKIVTDTFKNSINGTKWGYEKFQRENLVQAQIASNSFLQLSITNKITVNGSNHNGVEERKFQLSSVGTVCLGYNSDSKNCGLTREIAILTTTSFGSNPNKILSLLMDKSMIEFDDQVIYNGKLLLNGMFIGYVDLLPTFKFLKELKLSNIIDPHASITYDKNFNLIIYTDQCRPIRPFYVINTKTGRLRIEEDRKWEYPIEELFNDGYLCYLDVNEQYFYKLAVSVKDVEKYRKELAYLQTNYIDNPKKYKKEYCIKIIEQYDFCEIDPSVQLSYISNTIPGGEYNPNTRLGFSSKHKTHANTNYNPEFIEITSSKTSQTEDPLVTTMIDYKLSNNPTGVNCIVAFMTSGNTREDAIIVDRKAVQIDQLFTYSKTWNKSTNVNKEINEILMHPSKLPDEQYKRMKSKCGGLEPNGLPRIGSYLKEGDIVISKFVKSVKTNTYKFVGEVMKSGETGKVIRVKKVDGDVKEEIVVTIYDFRNAEDGIKVAEVAQKFTIKIEDDMPFISDIITEPGDNRITIGSTPDIIINTSCIPNRTTGGILWKSILGLQASIEAKNINMSIFGDIDKEAAFETLRKNGLGKFGLVQMTNSMTGEPIEELIHVGVLYFANLGRDPSSIAQSRAYGGNKDPKTQQAIKTGDGGGSKTGWMERNALDSYGNMALTWERLHLFSDAYSFVVCTRCSLYAKFDKGKRRFVCNNCLDKAVIGKLIAPFTTKLLRDLLAMLGIKIERKYLLLHDYKEYVKGLVEKQT